jgi:hypothetical protein
MGTAETTLHRARAAYLEIESVGQTGYVLRFVDCGPSARFLYCRPNPTVSIMGRRDVESWQEGNHKEDNGWCFTRMFAAVDDREVRFIWVVTIGRNQRDHYTHCFSEWGIFGSLIE